MTGKAVRPEDILADHENTKTIRGVTVRKASIAATLRNIELLESGSEADRKAALAMIKELAPGLVVLGMHRHFQCRNPEVEAILAEAAAELDS